MEVNPHLKAQTFHKYYVGSLEAVAAGAGAAAAAAPKPSKAPVDDAAKLALIEAKKAESLAKRSAALAAQKAQEAAVAAAKKGGAEVAPEDRLSLPGAVMGKVVTRFPPEASGFIHIGHAKAALVNSMLRTRYNGKMVFRFDDTNPVKEKAEFEAAILEDLGRLGVRWDVGPTHTSDYFDIMIEYATHLVTKGLVYCDKTEKDKMRQLRGEGIATEYREQAVEETMRLWREMLAGSAEGQLTCMRAKISLDAENKALRDPVMYRVNLTPHVKTGTKYKAYPTYDFACPIVDSIEGVTHALRTNEYHDRNAQYFWILDALKDKLTNIPCIEDFSRLNMEYSLMSKRKLTQLVNDKVVDGWDDPRFPTVRGLLRRGLQVAALQEFVAVQGMSKAVNFMEWSKLWVFNNQILDPIAPRYSVVNWDIRTTCTVVGASGPWVAATRPLHRKNPAIGEKTFYYGSTIYLDAEDVALLAEGEEVTLMDWGNAFVSGITKDAAGVPVSATVTLNPGGDVKKTKYKLTWVAHNPDPSAKPLLVQLNEYDHILTKRKPDPEEDIDGLVAKHTLYTQTAIAEEAMATLKKGDTIQLERRGFYIVDSAAPQPLVLIFIPDGRDKPSHLSARVQFYKLHPELIVAAAPTGAAAAAGAATKAPPATGGSAQDTMTLEEKRALKAKKKEAVAKP